MNWLTKNWGKLVTFILVALVGMRILDLLMLWKFFSTFTSTFRSLGVTNDYLVSAMSVVMMTIAALLLRHLFLKLILRRTEQGTLIFGGAITAWMLLMYFVSLPDAGEYFNPVTGQPRYVYAIILGEEIDLKPLGYKYHPFTGEEMRPLTKEVMKQYTDKIRRFEQRQPRAGSPPHTQTVFAKAQPLPTAEYPQFFTSPEISRGHELRTKPDGPYSKTYPQSCAEMRVKSIRANTEELSLLIEYKNTCEGERLVLMAPENGNTYVVSDKGEALICNAFSKDAFPTWQMPEPFYLVHLRVLLPREVWRLGIWFPPLTETAKQLTFTHQNFDKVVITLLDST